MSIIENLAALVHEAYLEECAALGWEVKEANRVPYEELDERSKALDRASVRAVMNALHPGSYELLEAESKKEKPRT